MDRYWEILDFFSDTFFPPLRQLFSKKKKEKRKKEKKKKKRERRKKKLIWESVVYFIKKKNHDILADGLEILMKNSSEMMKWTKGNCEVSVK